MSVKAHPDVPPKIARWYRAGVQLLVEATGRWPNREAAHFEIMIRSKRVESFVINDDGETRYNAMSTLDWGYTEWREYLDDAIPIMMTYAGESRAQFRDRVDKFFGMKLREAWEP